MRKEGLNMSPTLEKIAAAMNKIVDFVAAQVEKTEA